MSCPQNQKAYPSKSSSSRNHNSLKRKVDVPPPAAQQSNGDSYPPNDATQRDAGEKLSRNGTPSSTKVPSTYDPSYLSPPRGGKFRPALINNGSRSGSEADSLLDLYGRDRSVAEGTEKSERDLTLEDLYLDPDDPESSRWIHRDKLAVIESHELQEAGIKLPRQKRSKSSLRHKRSHSRNQSTTSAKDPEPEVPPTTREGKRQKVRSPVQQNVSEDPMTFDLRMPEEIAAEASVHNGPTIMYHQPNLGRSGSKIPLPKTSPLPIAQGYIDRSAPLPRNRRTSGHWSGDDGEGFSYNRIRSRSNSVGSRVLLDAETNGTPAPAPKPGSRDGLAHSPPKQRSVSKPTSVSNARPRTSNGPRNVSEPQKLRPSPSTQRSSPAFPRPRSRNGLEARPATAVHRLEGDAPWIAEMYKPDPRLPPEQQMLPTHAKRLQQEQREREARDAGLHPQQAGRTALNPERPVGITRTPSPMAAHSHSPHTPPTPFQPTSPNQTAIQHTPQNHIQGNLQHRNNLDSPSHKNCPDRANTNANSPAGQWPLKVAAAPSPIKPPPSIHHTNNTNDNRHANSSSPISPSGDQPHGGYSTIPKVQSTPPVGSAPSPKPMPQATVQEKPMRQREKEGGKGCGCCVVM
ncbi:MAG: hypothetical protein Q9219_007259 [cf. Caloplaca sp. 3 TL-2023]